MTGATTNRPTIAITMGDASGIGPEVIMKALSRPDVQAMCRPLVVGDAERLRTAGRIVGSALTVNGLAEASDARFAPGTVECLDLPIIPKDHPFGKISTTSGEGAFRFIERAVRVGAGGRSGRDLHRPPQQGGAARRRPQIPGPHGDAGGADRHAGSVDDAGLAQAPRDPRDDPRRADRRHRAH